MGHIVYSKKYQEFMSLLYRRFSIKMLSIRAARKLFWLYKAIQKGYVIKDKRTKVWRKGKYRRTFIIYELEKDGRKIKITVPANKRNIYWFMSGKIELLIEKFMNQKIFS